MQGRSGYLRTLVRGHVRWDCDDLMSIPQNFGRIQVNEDQARDLYLILKREHHARYSELRETDGDLTKMRAAVRRIERVRKRLLVTIRENGWPDPA